MDAKQMEKLNEGRVLRNSLPQILAVLKKRREGAIQRLMQDGKSGADLRPTTAEIIVYTELENEFKRNVHEADRLEEKMHR